MKKVTNSDIIRLGQVAADLDLADAGAAAPGDREVSGAYCSDLLSDVMGGARPGEVWVTVQSHLNVVAVAALKELAAVVICGGRSVEDSILKKASEEGVAILLAKQSAFEVCGRLWELGLRHED